MFVFRLKRREGMTVLEILISAMIMVLLFSICSQLMIWGFKISRKEKGLVSIRNESAKGITWIVKDLRKSSKESLIIVEDPVVDVPVAFSFLSPVGRDVVESDTTTRIPSPRWKVFVIYYLTPDRDSPATVETSQKYLLERKTYYDSSYKEAFNTMLSMPEKLKLPHLTGLCNGTISGESRRTVAKNIYDLDITGLATDDCSCTITIITKEKGDKDVELESTYTTTVTMRNTIKQPF